MKLLLVLGFLLSFNAFADEDFIEPSAGEDAPQQEMIPYRLFRAEGTHVCWSDKVIGNQCFVSGGNYTDCLSAHFALKSWDCCRNTPGSHSVNFIMSKCTNFM